MKITKTQLKQIIKEEITKTLNEFELGVDLHDDSDAGTMRDIEWVNHEKEEIVPAIKTVLEFLESDEVEVMEIEPSALVKRIKWIRALHEIFTKAPDDFLVKLYHLGVDKIDAINESESMSDPFGDSPIYKMGIKKGFPKAAAANKALAKLATHGSGNNLLKGADKHYFKGKLGEFLYGAQGLGQRISSEILNTPSRSYDGGAPKTGALDHLEEVIRKELGAALAARK